MEELGGYRLIEELGSGGMGVVYLGVDGENNPVAVKVLHPHIANDDIARRRLAREVRTLRRIKHPRIAEVLDAELESVQPFIVTEFVDGLTLSDDVKEHGPFAEDELVHFGHALLDALHAVHEAGVIHRDLKPANIMIMDGEPMVIDFGIAQAADEVKVTATGLVMGTPGYLSPEIADGKASSEKTDWWGWAASMAFAATGRNPYGSGPLEAVLGRVAMGRANLEGVPELFVPLLRACLDPRPERRPSGSMILDGLVDIESGRMPTLGGPVRQTPDASSVGAGAAAAGGAAVGAAGAAAGMTDAADSSSAAGSSAARGGSGGSHPAFSATGPDGTSVMPAVPGAPGYAGSGPAPGSTAYYPSAGGSAHYPNHNPNPDPNPNPAYPPAAHRVPRSVHPGPQQQSAARPGAQHAPAAFSGQRPYGPLGIDQRPAQPPQGYGRQDYGPQGYGHPGQLQSHQQPGPGGQFGPPGPSQPARLRGGWVLLALNLLAIALTPLGPFIMVIATYLWQVLARTAGSMAKTRNWRQFERGPGAVSLWSSVSSLPGALLGAVFVSLFCLILPLIAAAAIAVLMRLDVLGIVPRGYSEPAALWTAALACAVVLWLGPGSTNLRRGSKVVFSPVTRSSTGVWITAAILLVMAALAVITVVSGASASWWPVNANPFNLVPEPRLP